MKGLKDCVAVVTGAAQGIGESIALSLGKRGACVVCLDVKDAANEDTAASITKAGGTAYTYHCDLAEPGQIEEVFGQILDRFGRIDILINNAAVFSTMSFVEDSYEQALADYTQNMDVNARGAFLCAKMAAPGMAARKSGQIINVVTNHVKRYLFPASSNEHSYDASKYALLALNESLDCELKQYGIRVNAICPAATRSPMLQAFFDSIGMELTKENIGACTGHASLLESEEVGETVCHMLEWDDEQAGGKAFLMMYSEDCEKLKLGAVEELAK